MAKRRILVVGGVAGGASCAARLRRLDEEAEIVIFERGSDVSFANCGLPYYLGGAIQDRAKLLVTTPSQLRNDFRMDIRTRCQVIGIDRQEKSINVRDLAANETRRESYDVLVLAPGAAPVRPPIPGIDLPGVFSLRGLEDADAAHAWLSERSCRRAVVVGAGYIGLEMVENLHRRNIEVVVLERLEQAMMPMDPEMVAPLYEVLRSKNVTLCLGNAAAGIERSDDGALSVAAKDGRRFAADIVVLAVGVKPETRLAADAGLSVGALGGIQVDEQMRTSDPAIFAVGDAVEVKDWLTGKPALIPLAGPANRQGRIAADAICGREASYRGTLGTAVVGVFELTLATTGANEKTLRREGIPFEKSYTYATDHAGYYPGAEVISLKLLFDPTSGKVLGAQAVGKAGVDKRIDVLATAIQLGATVFDLEAAELCYAPQYGSAKDPVNIAGFAAGNILRGDVDVRHWSDWKRKQAQGQTPLTLDVRPHPAVAASAIPGTIRIPLGELRNRLEELPRDQEIWVHCGFGKTSYFAVRLLKQHGFRVKNLSGGITSYFREP